MSKVMMIVTMVMMGPFVLTITAGDGGKKPEKLEVRHSMMGYRDTVLFYSFPAQHAVLVVNINNKDETFPVTGTVYLFDKATTEEGLKKWINNQHSDGLFPDVPKPASTHKLPKDFCTITARKKTGTSKNPGPGEGTFKDFEIAFTMKAQNLKGKFQLAAFKDTARVHVKNK